MEMALGYLKMRATRTSRLEQLLNGKSPDKTRLVRGEEGFKEQSFDFTIVLLDVDDTLPRFRSVAEPEESAEVWEDMEMDDEYDM